MLITPAATATATGEEPEGMLITPAAATATATGDEPEGMLAKMPCRMPRILHKRQHGRQHRVLRQGHALWRSMMLHDVAWAVPRSVVLHDGASARSCSMMQHRFQPAGCFGKDHAP
eukprot:1160862-Pelagomonas_calceolata.AAC.2